MPQELQNQNENLNEENQNQENGSEESQSQASTNTREAEMLTLMNQIAAQNRANEQRARELEDQLSAMRNNQTNQSQNQSQTNQVSDEDFWKNPAANLSRMIAEQNRPVVEFMEAQKKRDAYNLFKQEYKRYPGFEQIEFAVDRYMTNREISHANMQEAIKLAIGDLVLSGGLNNNQQQQPPVNQNNNQSTNQNQNQNQNNNVTDISTRMPAHLRPSASQLPSNNSPAKPQLRQLNELEKRLAKENKMTDAEYLHYLESNTLVSTWKK